MAAVLTVWICVLSLLWLTHCSVIRRHTPAHLQVIQSQVAHLALKQPKHSTAHSPPPALGRLRHQSNFLLRSRKAAARLLYITRTSESAKLNFNTVTSSIPLSEDLAQLPLVPQHARVNVDTVLRNEDSANSFLSRKLLYNSWDFELVVPDNLQRECLEEICSYEEAREVFEDDAKTEAFWTDYVDSHGNAPRVDVSGLVAGILAVLVCAVFATVLGIYCYKAKNKGGGRNPVRMANDGRPAPETVPLSTIAPPGLPSYRDALNHSGQHDAPPPPYSGGAPSEPADPGDQE